MKLSEAIVEYLGENLPKLDELYTWKVNLGKFELKEMINGAHTNYRINKDIRNLIASRIKFHPNQSAEFQLWYVREWGGVRGNKLETLATYLSSSPDELIALNTKGVASWSKMLCVRDPAKYAIYDARVAVALNSLQKWFSVTDSVLFPLLPSRNTAFVQGAMKAIKKSNFYKTTAEADYYSRYLSLLNHAVKNNDGYDIQDAEMVLFATAKELSNAWKA